jgi:hypothetical protein
MKKYIFIGLGLIVATVLVTLNIQKQFYQPKVTSLEQQVMLANHLVIAKDGVIKTLNSKATQVLIKEVEKIVKVKVVEQIVVHTPPTIIEGKPGDCVLVAGVDKGTIEADEAKLKSNEGNFTLVGTGSAYKEPGHIRLFTAPLIVDNLQIEGLSQEQTRSYLFFGPIVGLSNNGFLFGAQMAYQLHMNIPIVNKTYYPLLNLGAMGNMNGNFMLQSGLLF